MTNILEAIINIVENPIPDILNHYQTISNNRINAVGDALQEFIKDAFANTISEHDLYNKAIKHSETFSWLGNQNNPPDLIIKNGDAVEVKKIESLKSQIVLNSSYPKSKLLVDSPMITIDCRNCEQWTSKDIIYTIGVFQQKKLRLLWIIYGDCYAADSQYYERIKNTISSGISEITGVEFAETKELGRVNKVDPLGITYLRIRGMWGIANPFQAYEYLNLSLNLKADFQLIALIKEDKYLSLNHKSKTQIESIIGKELSIAKSKIKSPNNPAQMIDVRIISYTKITS